MAPELLRGRAVPPFPDRAALETALTTLGGAGPVVVLRRRRNEYASTFPTEIVTCRMADGRERRLFCKYAAGRSQRDHGHRGDVVYEARVYAQALAGMPLSLPALYGARTRTARDAWLVVEYLDDALRIHAAPPRAMPAAAAWAGKFHALQEDRLRRQPLRFLKTYDATYYTGWSRRVRRAAVGACTGPAVADAACVGDAADLCRRKLRRPRPAQARTTPEWLLTVCRYCEEEAVPSLCTGPTTVIHGEFTVHNVLWHRGRVVPVDWESAACAAGEIDLALLLDEWDTATISACTESYSRARWPNGADPAFPQRLDAAWYYVLLRWLADCTDWTTRRARGCLRQLHRLAQRRGVIS